MAESQQNQQSKRGLANADEETRQRVASEGGKAVSQDREHMARIGSEGGKARNE